MHRVFQTILEAPHGNALQACVASILALPLDDVPNFVTSDDYWKAMLAHAELHGLGLVKVPLVDGRLPFPTTPATLCIARGASPRGPHGHVIVATVASDGTSLEPVHDPFPAGGFLVGPVQWAAVYTAREPSTVSAPAVPSHATLADELRSAGLDVIAPMRVSWYNDYLRELGLATDSTTYLESSGEEHASGEAAAFKLRPLPDYNRDGNALAFLIGNSKALWPSFLSWLAQQGDDPTQVSDPVDTYTGDMIKQAVERFAASAATPAVAHQTFWAHEMTADRLVDMNRVSRVCGACYFSDEMFLSVHPTFGSWVAFRAVVVFDLPATHLKGPPPHLPSLISDEEAAKAKVAFQAVPG